ncbi:MAG: succinate dehydrogenase/fumarate reductase iron-sulfur subunit [Planctomycetota bacterium]
MNITLKIWRQEHADAHGRMETYEVDGVTPAMSFLEMLDVLNQRLVAAGERVIAFDHDCREGICGQCSLYIDGRAHGPHAGTSTCQLHMRSFSDGDTIHVEPWRARAFPVIQDLVVDRSALDRIVEAGGYVSVNAGTAPEANSLPIGKDVAEHAFDAAACIGCGACVAACKNGSAMLFTAAKVSHLAQLPQGEVEARARVRRMVDRMDAEGFGNCSNLGACEAVCPKEISVQHIGRLNWEYVKAAAAAEA